MIHIVLPAYNEEANIRSLLEETLLVMEEVLPHRELEVVLVNDGSDDGTGEVIETLRTQLDTERFSRVTITVLDHDENRGLAEAIRTGLTYCAGMAESRDIILTMDSDNSHTPGLIPSMVRLIHEGHDVVIASRYQRGARVIGVPIHRRFLGWGASWLFRALFPIPCVRDYTCGYRAYRATLIQKVLAENPHFISEQGFSVMVDILLKLRLVRPEVMMAEVPLLLRYDRKQGASKMNVGHTIAQTLKLAARRRLGAR